LLIQIGSAAEALRNATHGGESDWFFPSKDELSKMYINLHSGTDKNSVSFTPVGGFAKELQEWYSGCQRPK
jgi:hypothetical protein